MTNIETVLKHVQNRAESMHVDFKRDFYKNLRDTDFAKDIAAFANLDSPEDRYIIFGVEDKTRRITGIRPDSYISLDAMDNYLENTVEPFVQIESELFRFEKKYLAYVKISRQNRDRPYMIKENCGKDNRIEKGDIYIRKGTCNQKAGRMDLDDMYQKRN